MNGSDRYLLDTCAIVSLLRGEDGFPAILKSPQWIGISIISYLEFLSFPHLTEYDRQLFVQFSSQVDIVNLDADNHSLIRKTIELRSDYRLKLPDAIIAATAVYQNAILVTADHDFRSISHIPIRWF